MCKLLENWNERNPAVGKYMLPAAAAAAKLLQLCPDLCDPIDGSPPGSAGFSRQEHWSGLPFPSPMHESEKGKWSRSGRVRLLATPWTAACQAPPSMGFSRQEYWSGLPLPSPKYMLLKSSSVTCSLDDCALRTLCCFNTWFLLARVRDWRQGKSHFLGACLLLMVIH